MSSSSAVNRRLCSLFTSRRTPSSSPSNSGEVVPKPSSAVASPEPHRLSRKASIQDISKERNLKTLVEKFTLLSSLGWFRRRKKGYHETVRRLSSAGEFGMIEEIINVQKKYRDIMCEGFVVRLISLYGKARMPDQARDLFDEMPSLNCVRTVSSFNALLGACLHSEYHDRVLEISGRVPLELGIKPDIVSYNTLLMCFCKMGSMDSALSLFHAMEKKGVDPNRITFHILLDALYGTGRFSRGEETWKFMEDRGIVPCIRSYNARMRGLVLEKRLDEAVRLFEGLLSEKGIEVDVCSHNIILKAYCDEGHTEEAMQLYEAMNSDDGGCAPDKTTFLTLLPSVCGHGDFETARDMCVEAVRQKCRLEVSQMQMVVDGLVGLSKVEDARKFTRLISAMTGYRCTPRVRPTVRVG